MSIRRQAQAINNLLDNRQNDHLDAAVQTLTFFLNRRLTIFLMSGAVSAAYRMGAVANPSDMSAIAGFPRTCTGTRTERRGINPFQNLSSAIFASKNQTKKNGVLRSSNFGDVLGGWFQEVDLRRSAQNEISTPYPTRKTILR